MAAAGQGSVPTRWTATTGGARGAASPRGRPGGVAHAAAWVVIGAVTAPVVRVAARTAWARSVVPVPDLWETTLATMGAARGHQWVGAWSRIGVFHLGPAWFYWAAPFLVLSGEQPSGLGVAAAALAVVSLLVAGGVVLRSAGPVPASVAAVVLLVGVHQLGVAGLVAPWNPTVLILPAAAGLLAAAEACAHGRARAAAIAALCGALVAQSHLDAMPLGLAVVGAGVVGGAVRRRADGAAPWSWRQGLVVGACVVLPWVPVAVDQVAGRHNAAAVVEYSTHGTIHGRRVAHAQGFSVALGRLAVLRQTASVGSLGQGGTASWAGWDLAAGIGQHGNTRTDLVSALLLAAALAGARPWRWRVPARARMGVTACRLGVVAVGVEAVAALAVRHEYRAYLVSAAAGVGLELWVAVAVAAVEAVHPRLVAAWPVGRGWRRFVPAPSAAMALAGLALVLLVPTVSTSVATMAPPDASDPTVATALSRLAADGQDHVVVRDVRHRQFLQESLQLVWDLQRNGVAVATEGPYGDHYGDWSHRTEARGPVLELEPRDRPMPPRCERLGPYQRFELCRFAPAGF